MSPPPGCPPFNRSWSNPSSSRSDLSMSSASGSRVSLQRSHSTASTVTLTSVPENLTFKTDSISYPSAYKLGPPENDLRPALQGRKWSWLSKKAEKRLMIGMSGEDESVTTLVGSSLDRKFDDSKILDKPKPDTRPRLMEL